MPPQLQPLRFYADIYYPQGYFTSLVPKEIPHSGHPSLPMSLPTELYTLLKNFLLKSPIRILSLFLHYIYLSLPTSNLEYLL